ncbi:MAG: GAF domain-containing protein, partial [Ignavibacteria bacterium]|nr:GAF domain-containing protein [Ignavibacteria bacterium]
MPGKITLTAETKYELLKEISDRMRDTLELDRILNNLLDALQSVVGHDASGIFVLSQDISEHPYYHFPKQYIAGIAQRGFDLPPEKDEMLTLGKGLIGHVIKTGESLVISDVNLDPRYIPGRSKTRSEIVVPIMKNGRVIGALDVENDKLAAFDNTDLEILNFFADAASLSIEKALLHHQILEKKKVEKQLQIAGEVQSRLLPQHPPVAKGYDFAGLCIPTYYIGGDYFDYIPIDKNNLGIAVADVSGDGIPAALIMTAFRALLRSQAKQYMNPAGLMKHLNIQLSEFTRKKDFVTA